MTKLTAEQQVTVVEHLPFAERVALRFRCDPDVAYIPLCEAVAGYIPGELSLKSYIYRCVMTKCLRDRGKNSRYVAAGQLAHIEAKPVTDPPEVNISHEVLMIVLTEKQPIRVVMKRLGLSRKAATDRVRRAKLQFERKLAA